ncbi:MAG: hypothetical protein DMG38_18110 [Acidobacteria bacterium]|nr:MAG: hypothetical protein DMG38_18110 [Acidobacteriota bacterium]
MVKRSPHATVPRESGVWRALLKTCVLSGWLAQTTYPKSSAKAVEAMRKQPESRMNKRMRDISPSIGSGTRRVL